MGHATSGPPLALAYEHLRAYFGPQDWWLAETPFEVCVGAILVQNTTWTQAEGALGNLRRRHLLEPVRLRALPEAELQELLRPAGTFRIKAVRLRGFLQVLFEHYEGSLERLLSGPTDRVRDRLLLIHGIGPETADCLLLYAGRKPSFVIDAYIRRVFQRHHWPNAEASYRHLQEICATELSGELDPVPLWQDFHAQMVAVGKQFCRPKRPQCAGCPLEILLPAQARLVT